MHDFAWSIGNCRHAVTPNDGRWTAAVDEDAEVIANVRNILQEKRDQVDAGDFRVNPTPDRCPPYCAMKHVCRVNALSRHKR